MRRSFRLMILLGLAGCAAAPVAPATPEGTSGPARPAIDTAHSSAEVQRYLRMGRDAAGKGKTEVALMMFHSAAIADKDDPAPRLAAAEALEDDGQFGPAAALYEAVLAQDKDRDPLLQLAAARARLKQPDFTHALADYQPLADRGDWRALMGTGIAKADLQDKAGSDAAFGQALAADGAVLGQVRANWARAMIARQDQTGAAALLESAQAGGTASADETRLLAICYRATGRGAEADQLTAGLPKP